MIAVEDYNPHWPILFKAEKDSILNAVSQWIAAIEHIGSTAVPGLTAKPTIDICIGVKSLDNTKTHVIPFLQKIGYCYLPELEAYIPERRYLQKLDQNGNHLFHIHIVIINEKLWNDYLTFRSYLIAHPQDAKAYAALKTELKNKFAHDRKAYTEGKADFIKRLEQKNLIPYK